MRAALAKFRHNYGDGKALDEMDEALNLDMRAQLIKFEGVWTKLERDAAEQFQNYRRYLQAIYKNEASTDVVSA
jgi:phosphomevalonate kinase